MKELIRSIALAAALIACGAEPATWPPEPAPVRLGEQACDACRMIVSEAGFAAQRHHRSGEVEHYDDLGCLLAAAGGAALDPAAVFVAAADGAGWLRGNRAVVVRTTAIQTPMGFGLAAFADRAAAEAEAARHPGADVIPLRRLLEDPAARPAHPSAHAGLHQESP